MGSILSNCDFQLPQTNYSNPHGLRMLEKYYSPEEIKRLSGYPTDIAFKKSPGRIRGRVSTLDESDHDCQWQYLEKG